MRIDRLDLAAFGCFTDRTLDLSAPGVHVVAGRNEAGKSTARHAVGQLLYGIHERSPYGFVHALSELRLAGLLRDARGAGTEIVRHKRRKNSLCAPDGTPLAEAELTRVLAGVGSDEFHRVFALDHDELRAGGKDLLDGKGDVGRALFESRSSSRLAEVQDELIKRSGELWLRNGRKPKINAGLARVGELRREVKGSELDPRDFAVAEKAVARAEEEHERLARDLRDVRARQARLAALRQALPQLVRRAELLARHASVAGSGPVVTADVVAELDRVTARSRKAHEDTGHDRAALAEAEAELAALVADPGHLAHADLIEALYAEVSAVRDAEQRMRDADEELWASRQRSRDLLESVRPGASIDAPEAYELPAGTEDRIAALRQELTACETALAGAREQRAKREGRLDAARTRLAGAPSAGDAEALRALLKSVPEGLAADLARADRRVAELAGKIQAARARHDLDTVPDADLTRLAVPARDQVDEHRAALDALRSDTDALAARRQETADRLDAAERDLAALLSGDAPPTDGELRTARADRDARWAALRAAPAAASPSDAAAYERAVAHADDLADRIRRQASESVRRVRLEVDVERDRARLDGFARDQAALDTRSEALAARWADLWAAAPWPSPPEPAAAARLVDGAAELALLAADAEAERIALDDLRDRERALVDRFRAELDRSGDATAATALRELTGLADLRITAVEAALREREQAAEAERSAEAELDEARADLDRAEAARASWETRWSDVVRGLGLEDRDPDTLAHAVGTLAEVAREAAVGADLARRRDTAGATVAEFDTRLTGLLAAWDAETAAGAGRFAQLADHHTALGAARATRDARDLHLAQADRLRRRIDNGEAVVRAAEDDLAALIATAGVADAAALREAVDRTVLLHDADAELADTERLLRDGGMSVPELVALAEGWTVGELTAEMTQLDVDVEHAQAAYDAQATELGRVRQVLAAIDDSARAGQAQEAASAQIAELAEDVEQYVRLELAREILRRCIEDYRKENQDPVLMRAQELFATLTEGRFTHLVTETEAKKGAHVLKARRAGAAEHDDAVGVEAMSEGTRDQLYLALRLATLERYAAADRAMPLILDDIAMTFDDGRTRALLRVLDAMADQVQVVLFTHHEHLGGLAVDALPAGRAHVHALPVFS
ncbi:ATP-binding protein [Yinghuangia seranimata]|uniref:ATP-binding protein n=1 Tax=Yinghuangia seranimata TaxID=408067 RepID=UPI00248CC92E|nr:YhaN family protein [Yinghuangia seranimata]MDI2131965.1 AAA family ATPase [Yinghuangia seranimata]